MPPCTHPRPCLLPCVDSPPPPLVSLQGDVRFAEVMGLMGANVEWAPYSITITGGWVGGRLHV